MFPFAANKAKLEQIVWPEIMGLAARNVSEFAKQGKTVVVLDAAVLLNAGWHKTLCHQVWSCIIKRDEAIKRIMARDDKSEDEAALRLQSQMSNQEVVNASNVVFCTAWAGEFTQKQVEKAWKGLQDTMDHRIKTEKGRL